MDCIRPCTLYIQTQDCSRDTAHSNIFHTLVQIFLMVPYHNNNRSMALVLSLNGVQLWCFRIHADPTRDSAIGVDGSCFAQVDEFNGWRHDSSNKQNCRGGWECVGKVTNEKFSGIYCSNAATHSEHIYTFDGINWFTKITRNKHNHTFSQKYHQAHTPTLSSLSPSVLPTSLPSPLSLAHY